MLEESNWKERYQVTKLKQDWEQLMGKTVARYTDEMYVQDKKLFIRTNVAALKKELSFSKHLLVAKINQYFEEEVIREVVIL
jgi:predicted nucleic acid-binding Zn ribbon protein